MSPSALPGPPRFGPALPVEQPYVPPAMGPQTDGDWSALMRWLTLLANYVRPRGPKKKTVYAVTGPNPTRALGTPYQNQGPGVRWASVAATNTLGTIETLEIFTDTVNPPLQQIAASANTGIDDGSAAFFVVLPGEWYMVEGSAAMIAAWWVEWQ